MKTNMRGFNGERFQGVTVAELRELLEGQPDDAIVVFTVDYGDYCHTIQALPLKGEANLYDGHEVIAKTGYSKSGFQFKDPDESDQEDEDEEDETPDDEKFEVVVLT